jgi:hypothetical protein
MVLSMGHASPELQFWRWETSPSLKLPHQKEELAKDTIMRRMKT